MKKIKKLIFILGLFLIPCFSSAEEIINDTVYIEDVPSNFVIGNYTYSVDNNINFTTNSTGNFIELKYSPTYNQFHHFFGWIDNKLYYVSYDHQQVQGFLMGRQGFINNFCTTTNLSNFCTNFNISADEFYSINKNINKIALGSFYYYGGGQNLVGLCFYNSIDELYYCAFGSWSSGQYTASSLTGSLGFSSESEIRNYSRGTSPYTPATTPTTPPTQYACPTIQQLIETYPQQYNTGLCYSSNLIYSGGTIQTITPKTIFELYPTRTNLNQDVQNYNTYCNNVATQQACQTIFEGKNEEYTLIAKIPQDVMPMQLYAYCNLTLNLDPNSTTCTASTGSINNGIGIDDIIDNIGKTPITVITPGTPPEDEGNGTGSVFDKYTKEEDETKRRNIIQKAEDTIQTMKEIYTKLTGIFRARQGKDGVVPPLITGLIALIILYKLFKK